MNFECQRHVNNKILINVLDLCYDFPNFSSDVLLTFLFFQFKLIFIVRFKFNICILFCNTLNKIPGKKVQHSKTLNQNQMNILTIVLCSTIITNKKGRDKKDIYKVSNLLIQYNILLYINSSASNCTSLLLNKYSLTQSIGFFGEWLSHCVAIAISSDLLMTTYMYLQLPYQTINRR